MYRELADTQLQLINNKESYLQVNFLSQTLITQTVTHWAGSLKT